MRALLPALLIPLSACGTEPTCSTKVLQVARDIGSDRYAVTELRDCGATTDYATIVRVGRASEPQSEAVEVFVADSDGGYANQGIYGGGAIFMNVVWTAPGELSVVHDEDGRVFKHVARAKGATIKFRGSKPWQPQPPT
ncbi:hypothetical protein ABS767_14745 [Sphingomonas sp. ST-64]|uniref:Lipoprotein n=1 Tax=Sphingomonas plantiphila TaxID=3163295 RepID=A0ABW8YQ21_9SPHN